jgi:hypothetical protein
MVKTFFDFEYVKNIKPELKLCSDEVIIQKFIENPNFVFNEKLNNFDYNFYISNYADLKHMNYIQACCHYLMHGIKENRNYNYSFIKINHKIDYKIDSNNFYSINKFFDYKYYIYKYHDLRRFNQQEAINHFLTYGMNEKRLFNRNLESIKQVINRITNDKFLVVCIDYLENYEVTSNNEVMSDNEVMGDNEVMSNKKVTSNNEVTNEDKISNLIKKEVSIIIQNVIKNNSFQGKAQNFEKENRKKELMNELLKEKLEKIKVVNYERNMKIKELDKEYNEKIRLIAQSTEI